MNFFLKFFSLIILSISISYPQTKSYINLDELIKETLQNNPQLKAARNTTDAARTKIDQQSSWDAPQVGIEFFNTPVQSFPNPIKNSMENDYFIQQMFPFPGKINAMTTAASNNASMVEQQYFALEKQIIKQLKNYYYELYLVQKKIEINLENQDLLKQFLEITRKQYELGMGKQPDILRAQTELSVLINEGVNLEKEKTDIQTMINTILSRPANDPLGYVPEPADTLPRWNFDQLFQLAAENRAELKSMNYNIDMYKSELDASKLEYYPDIMARLMYKDMTGTTDDFWAFMVGVNVPLAFWSSSKYTGKVEENELNIKTAEEQYNLMKNMVASDVQNSLVNIETNRNLTELYKNSVIPQAEQTLQSTIAAYQTGKTEFLMLIDAYRMLLMSKLDFYMSKMNFLQSQAQLEQAVGLTLEQIKNEIK
ncbi:MAG TPA: TolC family protein [Ignavibacteriaceae bacterium]|nr:TolC family protein [Ignavibacteriaceae bacterium]